MTQHRTTRVDGRGIFFQEAGRRGQTTIPLLNGFPEAGGHPYPRDLENMDFNILDTRRFAPEDHAVVDLITTHIRRFTPPLSP